MYIYIFTFIHRLEELEISSYWVIISRACDCYRSLEKFVELFSFEAIFSFLILEHFQNWDTKAAHEIVSVILILIVNRDEQILIKLNNVEVEYSKRQLFNSQKFKVDHKLLSEILFSCFRPIPFRICVLINRLRSKSLIS